jgi:hypothetical protein
MPTQRRAQPALPTGCVLRRWLRPLVAKELIEIFTDVSQGTIYKTANLSFEFVNVAFIFGKPHPTKVDRLPNLLVNLCRAEHLSHLVERFFIGSIKVSHGLASECSHNG